MSEPRPASAWLPPTGWTCILVVVALVGAALRLDQFAAQVLLDDEWHAVHQVLRRGPAAMFIDFGFSDYSIPLGILDWTIAHTIGLSETAMRVPMLLAGLATLVLFPLYVARRFGPPTAVLFAALLAISPLLILYSRTARPYAITLLLGWIAHAAFAHYAGAMRGRRGAGTAYVIAAAAAAWLHPIVAPFVLAPLLHAIVGLPATPRAQRGRYFMRLLQVILPTGILMAALLLPPLLANPGAMSRKGGIDMLDAGTLVGVWYAWLGTPSSLVVAICMAFAAYGARDVWKSLAEARTATLGIVLTLLALVVTRPMWSFMPLSIARYLLPFLPLLLLAVAVGAVRLAHRIATPPAPGRQFGGLLVALLPCIALASQSPLFEILRRPSAQSLHLVHHLDFRPAMNPYVPRLQGIPLSPFWAGLASHPRGSLRVAAAPFHFESYDWDAPRWEQASGQTVLPGFVTGLCVDQRWGEVPPDPRFRFDNAVHLADRAQLVRQAIDYVVWQKPYMRPHDGRLVPIGGDTAFCERVMLATFGPPVFEDAHLIAFRVAPPVAGGDAAR